MRLLRSPQHQVANTTKVASDTAAAAQSNTISATSTLQQGIHYAVLAAQKAFLGCLLASPIVGPELGAIAAGATFTAVLALNTFDKGGIVAWSVWGSNDHPSACGRTRSVADANQHVPRHAGWGDPEGNTNHFHLGGNSFSSADGDFRSAGFLRTKIM